MFQAPWLPEFAFSLNDYAVFSDLLAGPRSVRPYSLTLFLFDNVTCKDNVHNYMHHLVIVCIENSQHGC